MQMQRNTGTILVNVLWQRNDGSAYHRRDATELLEESAYPEIW